jgi:hypothetical protein
MGAMPAPAEAPQEHHPLGYREPCRVVERSQIQDPVTGLPLWRYRFATPPRHTRNSPLPARAWRVLSHRQQGEQFLLESEFALHTQPFAHDPTTLTDHLLDPLFESIAEAERLGSVHGDLGIHRLWWQGRNLRIEGYGVPWRPGASVADDVRALAASLLDERNALWSEAGRARLRAIAASGDPHARAPAPRNAPTIASEPQGAPPPAPAPTTAPPLPGRVATPAPAARKKRPPATPLPTPARWVWPLALVALLLSGSLWWVWGRANPSSQAGLVSAHSLQVTVLPSGRPPASLVVLRSPEGSLFRPGTVLGSVPGTVSLDRHGAWIVQGRFLDSFSEAVELIAPFDLHVSLSFPAAPRPASP